VEIFLMTRAIKAGPPLVEDDPEPVAAFTRLAAAE